MIFNKATNKFVLRVLLLFIALCIAAFLLSTARYTYFYLLVPVIIYQLYSLIKIQRKVVAELEQFVSSIQYRDFTSYYDTKFAPSELKPIRQQLNEINKTFRIISKEKETQYHYLQKMLEMVNTGMLSYDIDTNEVAWMNESLKKLLQISYFKNMNSLSKRDPDLYEVIQELPPGQIKIATAQVDKRPVKILLSATIFLVEGKTYKLLAVQNVNEAIDETESKAWQKLLNVMTHEIMNSVAPISSLADTLKSRLNEAIHNGASLEELEDLEAGFNTIKRRSEGLMKFAETYRNLSKITKLNVNDVNIEDLFSNLHRLMKPTFDQKNIMLEINVKDPSILLKADPNLLEQVIINLLLNGIEATKGVQNAKIILSAYVSLDKKVVLQIADNGVGISEDIQDKIFIPFFSTKKNGSGIGLSLCKQIIMLHKGSIEVQSALGSGTTFILTF